jgi:hypothetical protein
MGCWKGKKFSAISNLNKATMHGGHKHGFPYYALLSCTKKIRHWKTMQWGMQSPWTPLLFTSAYEMGRTNTFCVLPICRVLPSVHCRFYSSSRMAILLPFFVPQETQSYSLNHLGSLMAESWLKALAVDWKWGEEPGCSSLCVLTFEIFWQRLCPLVLQPLLGSFPPWKISLASSSISSSFCICQTNLCLPPPQILMLNS